MAAHHKPLRIGAVDVRPGQRVTVDLPVARLYTDTSLSMPVRVIRGRRAGPVLFLSAAVHGDELNGVEIIRRLLKRRSMRFLRGTRLAVPIVNVHGFIDQSRYLPDRRDLNRSFPGSAKGSIAARLANTFLKEVVLKSDFGIDLHTGAIDRCNLPHIRANLDDPAVAALAEVLGAPVIVNAGMREGSLRACAAGHGIPVMIYEAGEALRFDEPAHLEGKGVSLLDVTGLAQKNGAVASHVRVAKRPEDLHSTRIPAGGADLVLGCDIVVTTGQDGLAKLSPNRSRAIVNTHVAPTADFASHPDLDMSSAGMEARLAAAIGSERLELVDATKLATALLGDAIGATLFLAGSALQRGLVPVGLPALLRAIELNGRAIEMNKQAHNG